MNESEFNQRAEDALRAIEDAIDESGADIDYEGTGGVLTLTFEDDSQVIVNRQGAARQLWVAARNGGHHFDYDQEAGTWVRDTDRTPLFEVLTEVCSLHAGSPVELHG